MIYPDIIMITEAPVGVATKTLISLAKYAPECNCLIKPNMGLNRKKGDLIQEQRMSALRKSSSEYVLIMDDDDELISPVPSTALISDYDAVLFRYQQDFGEKKDFRTCRPSQIFIFCGVILKKEVAVKALEYTVKEKYLREDIGFFYFIMTNNFNVHFSEKILINKIGQREPKRGQWLRSGFQCEFDLVWRDRINKIRRNGSEC